MNQVDSIFELIIDEKKENLLERTNRPSSLVKALKCLEDNDDFLEDDFLISPFILLNYGAPKSSLKNSVILNNLNNLMDVNEWLLTHYSNPDNIKVPASVEKICAAMNLFKKEFHMGNNLQVLKKNVVLLSLFKMKKIQKEEIDKMKQFKIFKFFQDIFQDEDDLLKILEQLLEESFIQFSENTFYFLSNIYYKTEFVNTSKKDSEIMDDHKEEIPLVELLKSNFKDKELLLLRLQGNTLEEIGVLYNVSRERIRQRQTRVLKNIPRVSEVNKYKEIFCQYNLTKDDFILLFNEDGKVFEFLNLILKKGNEDVSQLILKSKEIPGSQKIEYLVKEKYFLNRFGELEKLSKRLLIEELLYKHKSHVFTSQEFLELYQEEIKKYPGQNLEITSPQAIDGMVSRSKYVIKTYKLSFRYYDLTLNNDDEYFRELVINLEEGSYSMGKIFREYSELMQLFDIRDEYELHNFYKRRSELLPETIKLRRSPEFDVGKKSKKDVVRDILLQFSGQELENVIDYLFSEFGFRKNTMASFISANFREFIAENNKIENQLIQVSDDTIQSMKENLVHPVYLKKQVNSIFKENNIPFNTNTLGNLGYYLTGNIVFLKTYNNRKNAIQSLIQKNEIWRMGESELENSEEMKHLIYQMEKDLDIVAIDEKIYANISFLNSKGVKKEILSDFIHKVYNALPNGSYFTFKTLKDSGFSHTLFELGFENIFYERLLISSGLFNTINRKQPILFAKGKEHPHSLNQFLEEEVYLYGTSVDIYDFRDDLFEKYGIELDVLDIRYRIEKTGIYYSDYLEKLFNNKEEYLDEVYK